MSSIQRKNLHLLNRACFGITVNDITSIAKVQPKELYKLIEKKSLKKPDYIDVADNSFKGLFMGIEEVANQEKQKLTQEQKKQLRKQSQQDLKSLNITWMEEMVDGEAQLREKMAFFWHGHFASRNINIFYQQQLLQILREHALGSFRELLKAVSKSAAMLAFLNNQQNRKQHPNENFAREVMELFTLGRGNYTETDIKEAARAFTGWGFNLEGEFVFRKIFHDNDAKTVLGKTGNFDGDAVLNILLEQKQTAYYITQKIYRYFVNEVINKEQIQWLANRFYQSDYSIQSLMRDIFTSSWFYEEKNIGSKIKSPVELLVGIRRLLPMEIENEAVLLLLQRVLGQLLFYPPNVAGWPGGKSWIDSSSLMVRLRIPQLMKDDDTFFLHAKADDDQQMGMAENYQKIKENKSKNTGGGFQIHANINWEKYIQQFSGVSKEYLFNALEAIVLATPSGSINEAAVKKLIDTATREAYIKTVTVAFMSTPEYQLC